MKNILVLILLIIVILISSSCEKEETFSINNGRDLIEKMHERYSGKWYDQFFIQQEVTYYNADTTINRQEIWNEILDLPAKVRSNIGNPAEGNCEIFVNDTFYIFRNKQLQRKMGQVHTLLLLGFDVYLQPVEATLSKLNSVPFDLNKLYESTYKGKEVYVVGAEPGDSTSSRFIVEKERLLFLKVSLPISNNRIWEAEFEKFDPFEEAWVGTEISFKVNGFRYMFEEYLDWGNLDEINPEAFDVYNFKIVE